MAIGSQNAPLPYDTTGMHVVTLDGDLQLISPAFDDADRHFGRMCRDNPCSTIVWTKDDIEVSRHEAAATLSGQALHVDDDYGSQTTVKSIHGRTLLSIRRMVRELNPGHISIYSDYDCTGLVCGQWCKFLKIYRTDGYYVAIVEITVNRDV